MVASYLNLCTTEFLEKIEKAWAGLKNCTLCPRECAVDRTAGELGFCRTGLLPYVASFGPHPGEEAPLRGKVGSGTIFFCGCNLRCEYCQNYDTSQLMLGRKVSLSELGDIMLRIQEYGCPNVNLVSPSHIIPQILASLYWAKSRGLKIPLVYNTGGYDSLKSLRLLEAVVDIYMPDMKYQDSEVAARLSKAGDYPKVNREAIKEMHSQVSDLEIDEDGTAKKGLLVRHLVLPQYLASTAEAAKFLAQEISTDTFVNIMGQYYPAHRAREHEDISKPVRRRTVRKAKQEAKDAGLWRIYI